MSADCERALRYSLGRLVCSVITLFCSPYFRADIEDQSFYYGLLQAVVNYHVVGQQSRVLLHRLLATFAQLHSAEIPHCSAAALAKYFAPSFFGYADGDLNVDQQAAVRAVERLIVSWNQFHLHCTTLQFADGGVKCSTLRRALELLLDPTYLGMILNLSCIRDFEVITCVDNEFTCAILSCVTYYCGHSEFISELFNVYGCLVNTASPKPWQTRVR
jgi:hypothetical protein